MTTEIISAHGWSWWHLIVAIPFSVVLLWQTYRWMITPIPWKWRSCLLSLRLLWSFLLLWCLWEPTLQTTRQEEQSTFPHTIVMVDTSASMNDGDKEGPNCWQKLQETVKQLHSTLERSSTKQTSWFAFGSQLKPWQENMQPTDPQSLIMQQLREAVEKQYEATTPTILFLLSDGMDTTEASATEIIPTLRTHSTRVFPIIPQRSAESPSLARIERITTPQRIFQKQTFEMQVELKLRHAQQQNFLLILKHHEQEVARQNIRPIADGTLKVTFPVQTEKAGPLLYTVHLVENKKSQELSQMSVAVMVKTKEPLRAFFVHGAVNPECGFMKRAIRENPSIFFESLIQIGKGFQYQKANDTTTQINATSFSDTFQEALPNFDVVILADLDPNQLNKNLQTLLLDFVQKHGGGILFLNGNPRQAARFSGTLLEELLPVVFDEKFIKSEPEDNFSKRFKGTFGKGAPSAQSKNKEEPSSNDIAMRITPEGLASEIWRDASTTNAPIAQPPPTFKGYTRVKSVKPGATILAIHPQEKIEGQPRPLMVSQNIGAGRSVFLGIDCLWRWRMDITVQIRDYDRFWQQLLLWLGNRVQGTSLEFDRGFYQPGNTAHIKLTTPPSDLPPQLFVVKTDESEKEIPLSWNNANHEGKADYPFTTAGEFIFTLRKDKEILTQSIVNVRTTDLEQEYSGLNEPLLQQLAQGTGGQCLKANDLGLISSLVEPKKETITKRERKPLWHSPWIFLVMLTAYSIELLLRRKWELT